MSLSQTTHDLIGAITLRRAHGQRLSVSLGLTQACEQHRPIRHARGAGRETPKERVAGEPRAIQQGASCREGHERSVADWTSVPCNEPTRMDISGIAPLAWDPAKADRQSAPSLGPGESEPLPRTPAGSVPTEIVLSGRARWDAASQATGPKRSTGREPKDRAANLKLETGQTVSGETSPSDPRRPRRLHTTARTAWTVVAGVGVVVALIGGVLTLVDRATPVPTARPEPTTPNIAIDVSTAEGGRELARFLAEHSNEVVHLDVRCFEREISGLNPCFTEGSGIDLTGQPTDGQYTWMWLFREAPCFGTEDEDRDLDGCQGEALLWIDTRTDGTDAGVANIEGAGSVGIRGPWHVKTPFGGAFFGPTVEGFELTPAD